MLEPQLPENRAEFDRYERLKRHTLWIGPLATVGVALLILATDRLFGLSGGLERTILVPVVIGSLVIGFAWMGYCEVQKTIIFRRDLRALRDRQ